MNTHYKMAELPALLAATLGLRGGWYFWEELGGGDIPLEGQSVTGPFESESEAEAELEEQFAAAASDELLTSLGLQAEHDFDFIASEPGEIAEVVTSDPSPVPPVTLLELSEASKNVDIAEFVSEPEWGTAPIKPGTITGLVLPGAAGCTYVEGGGGSANVGTEKGGIDGGSVI